MPIFRKRPIEIEARPYDGSPASASEIIDWAKGSETPAYQDGVEGAPRRLRIATLEGHHTVVPGAWVIKGVSGEFYPCDGEIFAATYEPAGPGNALPFSAALEAVRAGRRAARAGWNGKGMFIFLVPGSTFKVNRPPLLGIYPEGTEVNHHAHIDMKTADGQFVPWLASQTDILAEDWEVLA